MQGELFEVSGPVVEASKVSRGQSSWWDQFQVTLRLDHLLIAGILALVLYVLVFSFGVEKGKRYAMAELKAEQMKQEQITKGLAEARPLPATTPAPSPQNAAPSTVAPVEETPLTSQYTIQVITFVSSRRAEEEVERLKKVGYRAFIIPRGKFFQVCTDAFENLSEARAKLSRLKAEGFAPPDAYIRPLNGLVTV